MTELDEKTVKLLPQNPAWLKDRLILLGRIGSHAYGTATPDSDVDYKGVCVPPATYFLGLDTFSGYDQTGGKTHKNSAGDVDVTILHINKFVKDAMAGVPNNLELLFLDKSDYLYVHPEYGRELIRIRDVFLSKQIMQKFGGYARSQSKRMMEQGKSKANRTKLTELYGYDTKSYAHTVRLLLSGTELLSEGTLSVRRPDAEYLLSLRAGEHTLTQALDNIERLEEGLNTAYTLSTLPNEPSYKDINNWLTRFNQKYIQRHM